MAWIDLAGDLAAMAVADLGVSVTLTRVTPGAMNIATGVRATTTATYTLTAIRGEERVDAVDGGGGGGHTEQVVYTLLAADLDFEPGPKDRLTDGAWVYRVVGSDGDVDDGCVELTVQRWLVGDEDDTVVVVAGGQWDFSTANDSDQALMMWD